MDTAFKAPEQLLAKEFYYDPDWYDRERRELFARSWVYACTEEQICDAGDFHSLRAIDHPLVVVRGTDGEVRAFHNICRHRGCEVLEGSGNTGRAIMCPYHRWTYDLEGDLRGVPDEQECFDDLEKGGLGLRPASVGTYRGMVFVNPDPVPADSFQDWIANMDDHAWPHDFADGTLEYGGEVVYEMLCNWKVFYENAIDGYHLGYLHENTLGRIYPSKNVWIPVGRNVVWYSTERDGPPQAKALLSDRNTTEGGALRLDGHDPALYPGVVMLWPLTILSPNPWGFYVSILEPAGPEVTNMRTLIWNAKGSRPGSNVSQAGAPIRLADLEEHPLDSGNFQIEDMWIVEKIQRNLHSPLFEIGPLAEGAGAESPLTHFQQSVLDFVPAD